MPHASCTTHAACGMGEAVKQVRALAPKRHQHLCKAIRLCVKGLIHQITCLAGPRDEQKRANEAHYTTFQHPQLRPSACSELVFCKLAAPKSWKVDVRSVGNEFAKTCPGSTSPL